MNIIGAAFTYFASKSQGKDFEIEVFERNSQLGGRIRDFKMGEDRFEIGGSILYTG